MQLKSISIENFLQYEQRFKLDGFVPGINVVYGDNEAGKSTLLRALRAVLFDRFNGKGAEEFIGYHGGTPEVSLEFELNGHDYTLEKTFSKKKEGRARLTDNKGQRWLGTEAETHLSELLQYDTVDRGLAKLEQQGIYGVLWVEQGSAWQPVSIIDNHKANQAIQQVLSSELTDMLSQGKGENLLKMFSDELNDYQTEKTGKPKGRYREILEQQEAAQQKLTMIENELNSYQDKVDQLSKQQEELSRILDRKVEENDQEQLQKAQQLLQQIEEIKQQQKHSQQALEICLLKQKSAEQALQDRMNLTQTLQAEVTKQQLTTEQLQGLSTEVSQLERDFNTAKAAFTKAKAVHEESQNTLTKINSAEKLQQLQNTCQNLNDQLSKAQSLALDIKQKQQQLSKLLIDSTQLATLRKTQTTVNTAQARFDAVATRIEYTIQDKGITLNNEQISGKNTVLISDPAIIKFADNEFIITPGGEDLNHIQTQLEAAKKQLGHQLNQLDVNSLTEAENVMATKNDLTKEIESLQAQIKLLAPDSIEFLEQEIAKNQAEVAKLTKQLADTNLPSRTEASAMADSSAEILSRTSENERQYHDNLVQKQATLNQAKTSFDQANQHILLLEQKLAASRKEKTDEQLKRDLEEKTAEKQQMAAQLEQLQSQLTALDHDGAVAEIERRESALNNTRKRMRDLRQSIRDLTIELQTTGQRGLAEEKQQAEQALQRFTQEAERLTMHVKSLSLLCQLIKTQIQTAKEMLVKPLTEAMLPYLKILFPGTEPIIDESFCLQAVLRKGVSEKFQNLSLGTREQLAILLRLAYADLLAAKGSCVPVILDDALVNSDDQRRDKMKEILHRASKKHQIILLTCHGNDYRDCGGAFLNL